MAKFATPIKLGSIVGETFTIEKIIWLNSRFGQYALLIRDKTDTLPAVSTSNQVVLTQLREMEANLPVTVKAVAKTSKGNREYLTLESA
jgi:hypothetical protein